MQNIPQSDAQLSPLPFELTHLRHWFYLASAGIQRARTFIDTFQPQTPEGDALKGIYADILALCLDAMQEAAEAHLPQELATLLAFQHAELEYMLQRRRQRKAAPVPAAAD